MTARQTWTTESGTYTVHLEPTFIEHATRIARKHYPNEIGAPLVGEYSNDGKEAFVLDTGPLSCDSRGSRYAFERGIRGLARFFTDLFNASGGMRHYVGEWHSHPGGAPVPSGTDNRNQNAIARSQNEQCPECILVILGVFSSDVEVGVFVYSRTRGRQILRRRS